MAPVLSHNRLGTILRSVSTGYQWQDADAQAYYAALYAGNGGDIDSQSLYSIDLDTFKGGLDTLFIAGKTNGWWTRAKSLHLYLGDSAATQGICAKRLTTQTFYGSPTFDSDGFGVSKPGNAYLATGIIPETDFARPDHCYYGLHGAVVSTTGTNFAGSYDNAGGTSSRIWIRIITSQMQAFMWSSTAFGINHNSATYYSFAATREQLSATTVRRVYIDGIPGNSAAGSGTGANNIELFNGVVNPSGGSPSGYADAYMKVQMWADPFNNDAYMLQMDTDFKNFQSLINRAA